jgi:HSP20 family protein
MLLTSFDPFVQEFDRLAQRVFGAVEGTFPSVPAIMPMDVVRRQDEILLRFDLPGIDPESIEVTVDRGLLTVSAKRTEEYTEGETVVTRERFMGSFSRRVSLTDTVDSDKIEASYHGGVLTIRLPLLEQARPRKVEIRTGGKKEITA